MGLLTDTNMRTNEFSDLTLAFYVTYLVFELPTGFLMQRLPTAKYLGLNGTACLNIHIKEKLKLIDQSSNIVGADDNIELYSEELWRLDDSQSVIRML